MISFIIPVYNVEAYLRDCLGSIPLADDVEIICVDDGSTDGSGSVLDDYARGKECVKVVHQENAGVSSARNAGLKLAVGDYVFFVDSDDVLRDGAIEYVREILRQYPDADIVSFGQVQFVDGEKPKWATIDRVALSNIAKSFPGGILNTCVWGKVYKRTILPEGGFKPYALGEDLLFVAESLARSSTLVECSYPIYGYRQRLSSAVHSGVSVSHVRDSIRFATDILDVYASSGKKVDSVFCRQLGATLLERSVYEMFALPIRDRRTVMTLWRREIVRALRTGLLSRWQAFAVAVCAKFRLDCVVYLLCAVPHRLKLMGLHR